MKYVVTLIAVLLLTLSQAKAKIYKYVDENGSVHLTNVPTDVKYKSVDREKRGVKRTKSTFQKKAEPIIDVLSKKYAVDPALIKAVIKAESDFNPKAVSKKGARGMMQLIPETAKSLDVADSFNMSDNIEGGVKYLKYLLDLFNDDVIFALAAYNAGENAVKKYKNIPPYPETQKYVRKVLAYYKAFSK
jgi:soluble lytic murein transglycosylase